MANNRDSGPMCSAKELPRDSVRSYNYDCESNFQAFNKTNDKHLFSLHAAEIDV